MNDDRSSGRRPDPAANHSTDPSTEFQKRIWKGTIMAVPFSVMELQENPLLEHLLQKWQKNKIKFNNAVANKKGLLFQFVNV